MSMTLDRADAFCARFGLRIPILLAPMAGASAPALSIAVANAGGLGALGAVLMQPDEIAAWCAGVRAQSNGAININLWIPDPPPSRDETAESCVRAFLAEWGPEVPAEAGNASPPDFAAQCEAVLATRPRIVSSIMGIFPPPFVTEAKRHGIAWFATATTVREALAAEAAGADAIVAQGMEAGGHRGAFDARDAERALVGLMALLPAIADRVKIPVVATGGIADGRGVAAALALGASAVQVGTAFLACEEAGIHPAWASAFAQTDPEDTTLTRAFSGRAGRSIATRYVREAASGTAPSPAPYPVQRALTAAMRKQGLADGDIDRIQAWAGQSARLAKRAPAAAFATLLWEDGKALLA